MYMYSLKNVFILGSRYRSLIASLLLTKRTCLTEKGCSLSCLLIWEKLHSDLWKKHWVNKYRSNCFCKANPLKRSEKNDSFTNRTSSWFAQQSVGKSTGLAQKWVKCAGIILVILKTFPFDWKFYAHVVAVEK